MTRIKKLSLIPLSIIVYICLGTVYSWSIFKKPLEQLFEANPAQSNLPYMFFLLFFAVLMPVTGKHMDKTGYRKTLVAGGVLTGAGWILSGFTSDIYLLTITYGIIAGAGVGIAYGVPITVISRSFAKNRGAVMGIILGGFGLSPFVTAPVAGYIIRNYGVLTAFKVLGLAFLAVILICSVPFRLPSAIPVNRSIGSSNKYLSVLLADRRFWGLWSCYAVGTLAGLMMIGITSPVGEELFLLSPQKTAMIIPVFAVFNAAGRPVFGWITDRMGYVFSSVLSFCLIITAGAVMLFAGQSTPVYLAVFSAFWFNLGGWLAIAPAATASLFSRDHYSSNYGLVFTAYGAGAILGGILSGNIKLLLGSYYYVFFPVILIAAAGIALALFLLRQKTQQEE